MRAGPWEAGANGWTHPGREVVLVVLIVAIVTNSRTTGAGGGIEIEVNSTPTTSPSGLG
jgi:hypothetical protein